MSARVKRSPLSRHEVSRVFLINALHLADMIFVEFSTRHEICSIFLTKFIPHCGYEICWSFLVKRFALCGNDMLF